MLRRFVILIAFAAAVTGAAAQDAQPQPPPPVVMYATAWCPYCAKARAYFAMRGIRYVEYDIEKSQAAHAEFKRLGGRGVPLVLVGRETMRGFSERGFDALLARASR